MTNTITFKQDDLGFIAQVAWAETERLPLLDPRYDPLADIAEAFEAMARGQVPATWDNVIEWLDTAEPFAVGNDILDLLLNAAQEDVA